MITSKLLIFQIGKFQAMQLRRLILFLCLVLLIGSGCRPSWPDEVGQAMPALPEQINYNFHVKPILSDRCFACHGPDAENQQAGLRLDTPEGAYAALASGNGAAIVPGRTGRSQLIYRILHTDPEVVMPPPESNLSLTPTEIATLIRWVEQGAPYEPHWAFQQPIAAAVPDAGADWARNEIDRFIAREHERRGIDPAPEAGRGVLARRLFFDLTGLPPTPADVDRFRADVRPDAYERLVDSLLALPAYGERLAAHWLEVARFADSEGYLDDFHHAFWPYRDWVIDAFNRNLPYDQFILWQVGGDQAGDPTREQILATAFNRLHKQNSEGGIIPEEFRVEYVVDRTNTVGTAFLGLTLGCARCHDHKYDPVAQRDYYALFAFFNSTVERGDAIFAYNAVENGQRVPNALSMSAGPVLPLPSEEVADIRAFLQRQITSREQQLEALPAAPQAGFREWQQTRPGPEQLSRTLREAAVTDLSFDAANLGALRDAANPGQPVVAWGDIQLTAAGRHGKALRSAAAGALIAPGEGGRFERSDPFTVSLWIRAPEVYEEAHVIYNGNNRIQGYRGWDVVLDSNFVNFRLNHAHPYQSLHLRTRTPLRTGEWEHFVWTYDGSSRAAGMRLFRNGREVKPTVERDFLYRSTRPYTNPLATVYMPYQGLIIGSRHYDQDFEGGELDEVKVFDCEVGPLAAAYLYDADAGGAAFAEAVAAGENAAHHFYDLHVDPVRRALRDTLRQLREREVMTIDTVQEVMVMGDATRERPTYVLDRGIYDARGESVARDVPAAILAWPADLPRNRYGLGRWLIHEDHPLTSRVAVNQFWYLFFGRGLVETVEDFGNQGALPTHPELLDWLAVDFRTHGWDVKRLVRQLVTSATYRQSSVVRPELATLDPDNRLLARAPRYRRSAEMIRDQALAVSGLLDRQIGGPSVFPYQPAGLWRETTNHPFFPGYRVDTLRGLHRRSIYTFWKRNMPPPSMLIFDAGTRGECQVRRQRSNTPLQALALLNDEQIIEACRALALRVYRHSAQAEPGIRSVFRRLLSREPTDRELDILTRYYHEELAYFRDRPAAAEDFLRVGVAAPVSPGDAPRVAALARVANTVMNTTEGYYKN
jgi:hypothetical protein